jgi:hypothetical protein
MHPSWRTAGFNMVSHSRKPGDCERSPPKLSVMGRQLPIIASYEDERSLLSFISQITPIRVFVMHRSSTQELWQDNWIMDDISDFQYYVWLTAFPWTPEYRQTGGRRCPASSRGYWYISNYSNAPVLEISRPANNTRSSGRIYWSKYFSASNELEYDVNAFEGIVNRIWNWIRKHGKCVKEHKSRLATYVLPDAYRIRSQN